MIPYTGPRRRRARAVLATAALSALVAGVAASACVRTSFDDGQFACTPGTANACPEGLVCARDGRCRASDVAGGDAGEEGGPVVDGGDGGSDPCPDARWRTLFDARVPEGVTVTSDGRVFAAGVSGGAGWIAELDRCDGGVIKERLVTGAAQDDVFFRAIAPAVAGEDLVVVGGTKQKDGGGPESFHGHFARDLSTRSVTDAGALPAGEATRIALAQDGTEWITGPSAGASSTGFVVRVGAAGCSATVPTTPGGVVARATNDGVDILRDGTPAVFAFIDRSCTVFPDARTVSVGSGAVDVNGLVAVRGGVVAIGTAAGTSPNNFFWLAETKLANASWNIATLDPNTLDRDTGRRVVADGDSVFAAVSQRASAGSGTPTLYRYDGPIAPASKPAATGTPFGPILLEVKDLAVESRGGGVYTSASSASAGGVARCTKAAVCLP